ncbi:DoxX family protein [Telluria mixta]|uniref:DoxX family protein n=1 Tax=Telluria mixta TaxID=34071 RepID=A0ABT2BSG5_9BURK|nr:DoxX family protein [Telluria mixta]MCS0628073.1 DoxX family protein [Telluria mixta]WEM93811.1 DoxX family protein [Telluria mixta]
MTTPDLDLIHTRAAAPADGFDRTVRTAGRVLVGVLFLWAGIDKVQGWQGALQEVVAGGLPAPALMLALTILLQVAGGAAIIAGRLLKPACWALAGFTALATVLYHGFWHATGAARHAELIPFMEHVCIVGGLLVVSTLEPGRR